MDSVTLAIWTANEWKTNEIDKAGTSSIDFESTHICHKCSETNSMWVTFHRSYSNIYEYISLFIVVVIVHSHFRYGKPHWNENCFRQFLDEFPSKIEITCYILVHKCTSVPFTLFIGYTNEWKKKIGKTKCKQNEYKKQ